MKTQTPKSPPVRSLERILAVFAALACLFITIALWRDVSARQSMWPLPGVYFIELPAVGILAALAFLAGHASRTRVSWIAAGIYVSFGLMGALSVGLCYAPIAVMFIMLAVLVMVRREEPVLQSLGLFMAAAAAQTAIMLIASRLIGTAP